MSTAGTRIEFRDVNKTFRSKSGTDIVALDNVTLTVEPGEILGVIGYSGAGKSTLVRMINGLDTPTSGEILLDGKNIVGLSESKLRDVRRNIGMIFQQFNLLNSLNAAGNIEYPLKLTDMSKAERKARVAELLEFVGLSERGTNYPEQLSGGQKQRVGIARALANNPSLLLADEATSALDPETTKEVLDLLREINESTGITIVVITHEMDVIRSIADKVAVMEAGRVVEYGRISDVFAHPQTHVAQRFVATSLRNTPMDHEVDELFADADASARLFTVELTEDSGFFAAASRLADQGVSLRVVHGAVTTLQQQSFGKLTVRLSSTDPNGQRAIEDFYRTLQQTTDIKEVTR
ncbi:methionine ABC transporter ATP-binding protein [Corynebacterium aquatimens]|uniref:D-methionine transport system ATP-binding protein n=1 Tax=Corynebacterium aquatimens TaxID=1190508 RepID=A0A931E3R6_9CORY|nr:methionine ABC transporter ATP-binding protein [Corynebacterium aquatimens]MBG6123085.1 D-methionine transport system ATP-binding protein [Corynebacterium aquatimens]WJY66581.1 Methionine import ATP-binding protein MetN 2 [Corynebacterium aquatimens]